jgi:hypothetical protein
VKSRTFWKAIKTLKFNQDILIFGFFLVIAFVFWFFNALSKEYTTDLHIPVEFFNFPDNKIQLDSIPTQIKVTVSATGYRVIDFKASTINTLQIDYKRMVPILRGKSKTQLLYILSSTVRDEAAGILGPDFKISKLSPDTLYAEVMKVVYRKVPVKRNFDLRFKKQYMLKDSVAFFPDSVIVKGVEADIDSIKYVLTHKGSFKEIVDSLMGEIELEQSPSTNLSHKKVKFIVRAEQFTEMELKLPIYVMNEPIGQTVKLFPSDAKIVFNVGFTNYQKISNEQFMLVADYFELLESGGKAILHLVKKPGPISNIRISPKSVDFIIENDD